MFHCDVHPHSFQKVHDPKTQGQINTAVAHKQLDECCIDAVKALILIQLAWHILKTALHKCHPTTVTQATWSESAEKNGLYCKNIQMCFK